MYHNITAIESIQYTMCIRRLPISSCFQLFLLMLLPTVCSIRIQFVRTADSNLVTVIEQTNPTVSTPLCADSYSKRIGTIICKQLGFSDVIRAEKVELRSGTAVNVLCGIRYCFTFRIYRCYEGVSVTCDTEEPWCDKGEVLIGGRCVSFRNESVRGLSAAELVCQKYGLSLFAAENKQQMDAIALLVRRLGGIESWVTAATFQDRFWRWPNGGIVPHGLLPNDEGHCLKVDPIGWNAANCDSTFRPLCQAGVECVTHRGRYNGRKNVTEGGLHCMNWNMVEDQLGSEMSEHKRWHHNYCRNPNGLKDRPWCYVSPETFQYCHIPLCEISASNTTDKPPSMQCAVGERRCGDSNECVVDEFVCDYETDCTNGADELNCPDWLRNFTYNGEFELDDSIVEIWTHIPHPQGCARRCLNNDAFVCASFSYNAIARVCALAISVSRSSLRSKPKTAFYRRIFDVDKDSFSSRLSNGFLELRKGPSPWAPFCSMNYTKSNEEYICESFGFQSDRGKIERLDDVPHWSAKCLRSSSCTHPDMHSCTQTLKCTRCTGEQFACASGECISALEVCDTNVDCATGDDEHNCDKINWRIVNTGESDGDQLEVQHRGLWQPVCADSLLDSYIPILCSIVNSSMGSQFVSVRSHDTAPLGWRLKCTREKCVIDGRKRCSTGAARLRCHSNDDGNSCGRRHVDMMARDPRKQRYARVVGGFDALPAAFPWTAAIRTRRDHAHHCGASILSNKFILTAAHCFDEESNMKQYEVVVGDWDSTANDGNEQIRNMSRIIINPAYRDLFADDLALIELNDELHFGKYVQPICLPPVDFDYSPGKKCVVSGWGSLGEASSVDYPNILQAAALPILPREKCIESSSIYESMSPSAFCAGYLTGGIDTCQGDSGGPFACQIDDVYYLGGVISWGDGCALRGRPGIYTMVVPYIEWIKRIVNL